MTFDEIIQQVSWPDVKAELLRAYPREANLIEDFRRAFEKLKKIEAEPSDMRIVIEEVEIDDGPSMSVSGRNGERNRDLPDFEHMPWNSEPGWADEEVNFTLSFTRWAECLGMSIDPSTLDQLTKPQIAAHCIWEMTEVSFNEAEIEAFMEELDERAAALKTMSPEEREEFQISLIEDLVLSTELTDDGNGYKSS